MKVIIALQFVDRGSRKMLQAKYATVRTVMTGELVADQVTDWQDVPLVDDEDTEKHKPLQSGE